ncbi:zinc ribbon domain-containing protein [Cohnella yongneupensis]|uniref:Zinc ribbon domain-containing protein n=1 Tax=Cohnella yongneupensis TaxID=425006 RepID=A0ABW0R0U5_9BACL
MAVNFCTNCGTKLELSESFCGECGTQITREPTVTAEFVPTVPRKINYKALAVIVIVIIAAVFIYKYLHPSIADRAIKAAKNELIKQGNEDSEGEISGYKFSEIETKLIQREDRGLEQEGRIRVSGKFSYVYEDKRNYKFFGTTVSYYKGEFDPSTFSFETDYESYEKDKDYDQDE